MSYEAETDSYGPTETDFKEMERLFYKQKEKTDEARKIISDFVCSEISYMLVNNLGDPFRQQDVRRAVRFLMDD